MAEQQQLPEKLYKYRSWSDPLHRRIISHREIWFASPRSFNDPFDCRIPMRYDKLSKDQFYQTQIEIFQKEHAGKGPDVIRRMAEQSTNELFALSNAEYELLTLQKQRQHDAETGIFTASSVDDDILMWSHYSDSHKGFCVELDHKKLVECVNNPPKKSKSPINPYKVQYPPDDIYPELLPLPGLNYATWMKQYEVKSGRWGYESEYRLIGFGTTDFLVQLDPGIITRVLLGCQMSDSDQDEIIHELLKQGGDIALERAVKLKDKFGLKFEPVEY